MRENTWRGFDDFKRDFLARFWSEEQQYAERMRLLNKRFMAGSNASMPEYFLEQVSLFRAFSPAIPEATIVSDVMRQFPQGIQALWVVAPDRTYETALKFLERQESVGRHFSSPRGSRTVPAVAAMTYTAAEVSSQSTVPCLVFPIPPPSLDALPGPAGNQVSGNERGSR
uniref:Uncharacterized protein n=1 Tax=Photinus pyralis TaxID=7054 RepID=A0A1Y1NHW1_PHOPY